MTGRELIMHILTNGLEDEPIVKDGKIVGLLTVEEAAVKADVGAKTIYAWVALGILDAFLIGDAIYIPANFELPSCY